MADTLVRNAININNDFLPWVNDILHLGNTIKNNLNRIQHDMKSKNARYVSKNIEINQEFYFAAP